MKHCMSCAGFAVLGLIVGMGLHMCLCKMDKGHKKRAKRSLEKGVQKATKAAQNLIDNLTELAD